MAGSSEQEVPEEDVQDFRFRELRKINFGDSAVKGCNDQRFSLLCTSNHFGFSFVGCKSGVYAFTTALLYAVDKDENIGKRNVMADKAILGSTHIPTSAVPIHLALSSDNLTLSVCVNENGAIKLYFYDVRALATKGKQMDFFCSITLSAQQDVTLMDLQWNPGFPNLLLTVLSTGVVSLLEVTDKAAVIVTKDGLFANCVCWSPKGKQLALGLKNGDIVQCTAKGFEEKRRHPQPPNMAVGVLMQVMDLHWLSSYEFAATYTPRDPNSDELFLAFLSTPTDKPPSYTYSDNPYGFDSGDKKLAKFYFSYLQQWGVLITCSNNSVDTPCFGREGGAHSVIGDGSRSGLQGSWWCWGLDEGGRVEPPLDSDDNDTHSVGVTVDYTSQEPVPINDTTALPASPLFLSLTDSGVLCPYTIINTGCSPEKITELMSPAKALPNAPVRLQSSASHSSQLASTPSRQATAPPPQSSSPFLKGLSVNPAPSTGPPGQPNVSLKSSLMGGISTSNPAIGGSQGSPLGIAAQKTPAGQAGLGLSQASLKLGAGGNIFGHPKTNPGLTTASATASSSVQFPFSAGLTAPSLNTQAVPSLNLGGVGFRTPQAPAAVASQQSLGFTLKNPGGADSPFSPKPNTMPPFSGVTTALPGISAYPTTQPPSFLSSGIASFKTTAPGPEPSFIQSPTPNKAPTSVINAPRPTAPTSILPQPGLTSHMAASTQSGLGQKILHGGPGQPSSMASLLSAPSQAQPPLTSGLGQKLLHGGLGQPSSMAAPLSTPSQAQPPLTSGTKTTPLMSSALPPKAGSTLGSLSSKPPPTAAPVSVQAATKQSSQEREPSRPTQTSNPLPQAPKKATATAETESVDASTDQEEVENRFAADIIAEIEKFSTEMVDLNEELWQLGDMDKGAVERLGTRDDLLAFSSDTNTLVNNMQSTTAEFKATDRSSDLIKEETLKGFMMYEEARVNLEKKNDPKYASLLKVRPLDSYSTKRLNYLRAFFLQISRAIDEVNSQLDAQLEKKYEERRQRGKNLLKAPSIQTVYSTLRDQARIIRLQNDSMAVIIDDMKKLKLIPRSWRPAAKTVHSPPRRRGSSPGPPTTPRRREDRTPKRSTQTPGKEKLRECLESIKKTPVKRVEKCAPLFASRGHTASSSLYSSHNPSETASLCDTLVSSTTTSNQHFEDTVHSEFQPKMPPRFYLSSSPPNSERSYQSFKPDLMISPDHNIAVRTSGGAYSALTTPQLSRQSSGPDVIVSQSQIAYKDRGKYISSEQVLHHSDNSTTKQALGQVAATSGHMMSGTGYMMSGAGHMTTGFNPSLAVNKTNAPSASVAKGGGTIHWGSPPSGTTSSAQPKPNISVSLDPPVVVPPLAMPVPAKNEVDLGYLRRTSPHRDLSQIRPPSSADTESSLLPNTSLSVPNMAPNVSVKENQFLGNSALYASSPHVQQINDPNSTPVPSLSSQSKPPLFNAESLSTNSTTASAVPLTMVPGMTVPSSLPKSIGGMGGMVFGQPSQSVPTSSLGLKMPPASSATAQPSTKPPTLDGSMAAPLQGKQVFGTPLLTKNLPSSSASATSSSSQGFSLSGLLNKSNVSSASPSFPFTGLGTTTSAGAASTTKLFTLGTSTQFQFSIGSNNTLTKPSVTTQTLSKSTPLSTVGSPQPSVTTSTLLDGKKSFQFSLSTTIKPLTTSLSTASGPSAPVVSVPPSTIALPFTLPKGTSQLGTANFPFGNKEQEASSKVDVKDSINANKGQISDPPLVAATKLQPSVDSTPKVLEVEETDKASNAPATAVESSTLQVDDKVTKPLSTAVEIPSETKALPPMSIAASPVSNQPPPASSQPPPVSNQPLPDSVPQPPPDPVSSQPPPDHVSSQPPPVSSQPPPVSTQLPPVSGQPPPVSTQPPPVSTQPPPVSTPLSDQAIIAKATVSTTPSTNPNPSAAISLTLPGNNFLKKEEKNVSSITSNVGSEDIGHKNVNIGGSQQEDNSPDDDDMMGDDDMEPIDDSTGQNASSGPSVGLGGLGFGLGKPQPKNVTTNPFGTPGSSITPSTQSGLLRSSAFGQNFLTPQNTSSGPIFGSGSLSSGMSTTGLQSMGSSVFGQQASFGSPSSFGATPLVKPSDGKVFGSGGASGGSMTGLGMNLNQQSSSPSFGSLASSGGVGLGAPSSGFGGAGMPFGGGGSSTLFSNNANNPMLGGGGSPSFASQGGSTGGNFSGANFSGWRK